MDSLKEICTKAESKVERKPHRKVVKKEKTKIQRKA